MISIIIIICVNNFSVLYMCLYKSLCGYGNNNGRHYEDKILPYRFSVCH